MKCSDGGQVVVVAVAEGEVLIGCIILRNFVFHGLGEVLIDCINFRNFVFHGLGLVRRLCIWFRRPLVVVDAQRKPTLWISRNA